MAKTLTGTVASKRTDKTIVVSVQTSKTHPLYRKKYLFTKRFMAHDEKNEANEGDKVRITETKPLSASKRFRLEKVIEKAAIGSEQTVEAITAQPEPEQPKEKPAKSEPAKKESKEETK
jgi:small subunit ribosomal protein S17